MAVALPLSDEEPVELAVSLAVLAVEVVEVVAPVKTAVEAETEAPGGSRRSRSLCGGNMDWQILAVRDIRHGHSGGPACHRAALVDAYAAVDTGLTLDLAAL